jgi:hypothetical protein
MLCVIPADFRYALRGFDANRYDGDQPDSDWESFNAARNHASQAAPQTSESGGAACDGADTTATCAACRTGA